MTMLSDLTSLRPAPSAAKARRRWFGLDAIVTAVNGIAYLLAASVLSDVLGPKSSTLVGIGIGLTVFATAMFLYASSTEPGKALGWVFVAGNAIWVVESIFVSLTGGLDLTGIGAVWGVLQALVVAGFTALQILSLRR